jgi:Phage related hypothetical protein (DUF1799)
VARGLYWRPPDLEQLAAFGLTAADYPRPDVEIWPENATAFQVFCRLITQWRMGFRGPVALDYNVLPFVFRMARVSRDQWPQVFEQLRVMEDAALAAMNEG